MPIPRPALALALLTGCFGGGTQPLPQVEDTGGGAIGNISVEPCQFDFGTVPVNSTNTETYTLENNGNGDLSVLAVTVGLPFSANATVPVEIAPGSRLQFTVVFQPTSFGSFTSELVVQSDDPDAADVRCTLTGLVDDDADNDGFAAVAAGGTDCDDADPDVNPAATEQWYDGVDANCDGVNDFDQDGDGFETVAWNVDPDAGGGDCQDVDPTINPAAVDTPYDGTDSDCDGRDDFDQDGDGYGSATYGGSDCDDALASVNPGSPESWDGVDENCDGVIDDGIDATYEPDLTLEAYEATEKTGTSLDIGDLDGNALGDFVVGSPAWTVSGSTGKGRVSVFLNETWSFGDTVDAAAWIIEGSGATDAFGTSLWVADDALDVGETTLLVGAPGVTAGSGRMYAFAGDDVALESIDAAAWTITGFDDAQVGQGVGGGDLDGDGLIDAASWSADLSVPYNYVVLQYGSAASRGAMTLQDTDMVWMDLCGPVPAGATVRGCGPGATPPRGGTSTFAANAHGDVDVDGDGYDDLLVGDGYAEAATRDEGVVWVIWGRPSNYSGYLVGFDGTSTRLAFGTAQDDLLGRVVGAAPDADGDGDAEIWMTMDATDDVLVLTGDADLRAGGFAMPGDATERIDAGSGVVNIGKIRGTGDWTGDGVGDVIVSMNLNPDRDAGELYILPAMAWLGTGDVEDLAAYGLSGGEEGGTFGSALPAVPRDADRDGRVDVVVGDPTGMSTGGGRVHVFHNHHGATP
jgi:hypothetical protein